jgi:hypothetical protein
MRIMILAALAAIGLGMGAANAELPNHNGPSQQSGDQYNYLRGGGG